jgi:hypothetical protein
MKKTILAALFATFASTAALADGMPSNAIVWDEASISYTVSDVDGISQDFENIELSVTKEINTDFFVTAAYGTGEFEDSNVDVDTYQLGFGYKRSYAAGFDSFVTASYLRAEVESFDADGFEIEAGVRGFVAPAIELRGSLAHTDFEDSSSDLSLRLGARYEIAEQFLVGLDLDWNDDATSYGVVASYQF